MRYSPRWGLNCVVLGLLLGGTPLLFAEQTSSGVDLGDPDPDILLTTDARLDFEIDVPEFIYFLLGSAGANIDAMDFSPVAASVGTGVPIGSTPFAFTAAVLRSNAGQVIVTESNNSGGLGMGNGGGAYISLSEIVCTSSTHSSDWCLALSDSGGNSLALPLSPNETTYQYGVWTFTYSNSQIMPAGVYGTQANGGRVTWTATTP